MGLFDAFKKKEEVVLEPVEVDDETIVAIADGKVKDITAVPDPVFAEKMMGESIAFDYPQGKVVLCSPANGTLSVLFPTGHAYGITMNDGTELLVHCGVDTVNSKEGFRILSKKQGDTVKAGDPIVEADLKKLAEKFDVSTMLIITGNPKELTFNAEPREVKRGEKLI